MVGLGKGKRDDPRNNTNLVSSSWLLRVSSWIVFRQPARQRTTSNDSLGNNAVPLKRADGE